MALRDSTNADTTRTNAIDVQSIHTPETVSELGPTLVIAPHPDDESLGCGGLISLLQQHDVPVAVFIMSDGTGSHRGSRRFDDAKRQQIREQEATTALTSLGLSTGQFRFFRLPDQHIPTPDAPDFFDAVGSVARAIRNLPFTPSTVVLPWRRDPHHDHRATWSIMQATLEDLYLFPRTLEYAIWLWDLGTPEDLPMPEEGEPWRIDVSSVLDAKRTAIEHHRSQFGQVIDDDPDGFILPASVVERCSRPVELYMEVQKEDPLYASQI